MVAEPIAPDALQTEFSEPLITGGIRSQYRTLLSIPEWLRLLFAVIVIPNLVTCAKFTAFSHFFRGWVNIEILVLAALFLMLRSRLVLFLLAVDLLFDLFEPVAKTYYFSPQDALDALQYLGILPVARLAEYTGYVLAYIGAVVGSFLLLIPEKRKGVARRVPIILVGVAVFALGSDICRGRYISRGADTVKGRPRLVRVPGGSLAFSLLKRSYDAGHWGRAQREVRVDRAAGRTLLNAGNAIIQHRANVVLVLLESWGELRDPAGREQILQGYGSENLAKRYELQTGFVPFFGATVEGETRELCGHTFSHGIGAASAEELKTCLPDVLRENGYLTVGIHGGESRMYGRDHWYPRIGFGTRLFMEDLAGLGMRTCPGGWVGICDTDVAEFIRNRLLNAGPAKPEFIHWVTLNSHLPIDGDGPESDHCKAGNGDEETLCIWSRLVQNVHRSIARIALDRRLSPTVFIVVGDHAPPFSSQRLRNHFSQEQVPFVALVPRELEKSQLQ